MVNKNKLDARSKSARLERAEKKRQEPAADFKHKLVYVDQIPQCDLCRIDGIKKAAYADANLGMGWGNVCETHFVQYGCKLGLGLGQAFALKGGK